MANPWDRHCVSCIGALSFPIGLHRVHSIDAAYCFRQSSVVCLSVCLCVGYHSKNNRIDRVAVWGEGQTRVGPRNHVLDRGPCTTVGGVAQW